MKKRKGRTNWDALRFALEQIENYPDGPWPMKAHAIGLKDRKRPRKA